MRSAALVLAGALCAASAASAQDGWEPLRDEDGIAVSERSAPGRALPELRGTVEIEAAIFEVLAVISDVSQQTHWLHNCAESRELARNGDLVVLYNRTDAPWPVADRDVVLESETTLVEPGKHVLVRAQNATHPAAPPLAENVRMPRLEGAYDLVALGPTRTRVTYLLDVDPGGSLPTWLAQRTARDTPFETLRGLRRQVGETRGRYADFVARWSARR